MQKRVCIIDLSASEIQIAVLTDNQFTLVDLNLPWEVGFQQASNGTLDVCFGETLDPLDSNRPQEVKFTELDVHLKEITDAEILQCLFHTFLEEILHRRLPESGYPTEAMLVYVITPYQWKPVHHQQLRKAFKCIENSSQSSGLKLPDVMLRGCLSHVLCLSVYYQKVWMNMSINTDKLRLFLIDFTRHDLVLYQLTCEQLVDHVTVELRDILRYPDFFMNIEKQTSDVHSILQRVGETVPVVVGFSGTMGHSSRAIIELLQTRCDAIFLETQETASLLGSTELIQQFQISRSTGLSLIKPFHFIYQVCFGVKLPNGQWVELVPKGWTPPYHCKKAFHVTGTFEKFDIDLFCGLSLTDNSDVHRLVRLEIDPSLKRNFPSRNPLEFILSVTLDDSTHGIFAAHLPNEQKPRSIEFTVPVLMD